MGKTIGYGPGRKLPNLLMKQFISWDMLDDDQRDRLTEFLHVPLDSFTLMAIRNCIQDFPGNEVIGKIPKNATMSFVANEATYNRLQQTIKLITKRAAVPAIYLDALAWNEQH